jgi:lipopolysaccharide export system permease protein
VKILDRYIVVSLGGPLLFGLAAFTLLFVAGELLNIARLVSQEHASLVAATKYFIYTLPGTLVLTFPMAMLLAVLLAMSRLSGDSEITAMRAGGISVYRIAGPMIAVGVAASILTLVFQEMVVPTATSKAQEILQQEIRAGGTEILTDQVVNTTLANGDRQLTLAQGFDPRKNELENTTIEIYRGTLPLSLLFAPRGAYRGGSWKFFNAIEYVLEPCCERIVNPQLSIDIGADPNQLVEQGKQPEDMSRAEIRRVLGTDVQTKDPLRYAQLIVTYHSKLARPFACLVFALCAIPLGVRPQRSSSGAGFGISIAIVFAFYVLTTICLAVGQTYPQTSLVMAWVPNVVFSFTGIWLLHQAASV